jgi:hypothetical protein
MRWAAQNRNTPQISICTFSVLLLLCAQMPRAAAQAAADINPEYTITTFEAPKGASVGIADGTLMFLRKDELISLDPNKAEFKPVPIENIEARSWTFGGGSVWILGKSKNFWGIHRIDPNTGKLSDRIGLEHDRNEAISYGYGSLWISTDFVLAKPKPLLRIDPGTKQITTVDIGGGFKGQLAISDGKIWLFGAENGQVRCLDPLSNKVIDEFTVGHGLDNGILEGSFRGGSYSYSIGDGMLWVGEILGTNGGKYVLSGFDLKTHDRIIKLESDAALWAPVFWNGYVWLSTRGDPHVGHFISRVDPRLKHTTGRILINASANGGEANLLPPIVVAANDSLWSISSNPFSNKTPVIVHRIQAKNAGGGDDRK